MIYVKRGNLMNDVVGLLHLEEGFTVEELDEALDWFSIEIEDSELYE